MKILHPVWLIFSRRTISRLAYWLSALGYDLRDHSVSNRIYLVYFCSFWLIWIGVVFAYFGNLMAGMFDTFFLTTPTETVISISKYALSGWGVVQLWQATRRSPIVFQEEDAYLLCQTPVDRRMVGLAWFLHSWMGVVLPFVVYVVILAFALVEWQLQGEMTILGYIAYIRATLRALSILVPLHAAILVGAWSVGAWRLWWKHEITWLHYAAPGIALIWLAALARPAQFTWLLSPIDFLLRIAYGGDGSHPWWVGFGLVLLYLGVGFALLNWSMMYVNLSRAAQETIRHAALQQARSQRQFDLINLWRLRQRLGIERAPNHPQIRAGAWVLVWKDVLQSRRALHVNQIGSWVWLFALNLGAFLIPNMLPRLLLWGLWTVSIGELTTHRLRNDLAHWWVFRSLPFPKRDLLLAEITLSGGMGILLGWIALLVSRPPLAIGLVWGILLPFLVVNIALRAMQDILARSKARALLSPSIAEENVPQLNISGILPGLISVFVPTSLLIWGSTHFALPLLTVVIFIFFWVITVRNMKVVLASYHWIE